METYCRIMHLNDVFPLEFIYAPYSVRLRATTKSYRQDKAGDWDTHDVAWVEADSHELCWNGGIWAMYGR